MQLAGRALRELPCERDCSVAIGREVGCDERPAEQGDERPVEQGVADVLLGRQAYEPVDLDHHYRELHVAEDGVGDGAEPHLPDPGPVSYTHLRAHETDSYLV